MQKRIPSEMISYLILKIIEEKGYTYGYELLKKMKEKSNGHWEPSYGTIYGALNRMEKNGFIERADREPEDRKYYQLTEEGMDELEEREVRIKNIGSSAENMVLGFLNVYRDIYGKEHLDEILEKIKTEFEV
ncbi:MAG: helix-turn-helix transcriptional regulator [Candidatus Thermoplasmatota archaeon]|nr:helix-turn-helix transcriptional regulator [Candidatus Thermoplasmatota archaeon]MBS3789783.1 helix-turn-helix transcriptional regulator [Candidatus Thermoplasmatota archaeon]